MLPGLFRFYYLYIHILILYNICSFFKIRRMEMQKKILASLFILVLIFAPFSCKRKAGIKGVDLDISFSEDKLSDYLITDMQFTWKTDSEFVEMSQDLNVFVHFWHNKNLILQDDHVPEIATSAWELGKEYTYSRRIYIPTFIDEFDPNFNGKETLRLSVGFFSPYDRSGESKREILEKKLEVSPPPLDTPEIIYETGWNDLEIDTESFLKQWRWVGKQGRCIVDNPSRDALLVIKGGVNLEALSDQKIIFKINDLILDEFIPEESYFEKSYNIKKEMLGEGDEFHLMIETDKVFIPAKVLPGSNDERELGVQSSFIYFR